MCCVFSVYVSPTQKKCLAMLPDVSRYFGVTLMRSPLTVMPSKFSATKDKYCVQIIDISCTQTVYQTFYIAHVYSINTRGVSASCECVCA